MATSTEHSVHLSIFHLPKRTYYSNQVFQFPSIWNLFFMAQTPMEVNTSTSSTSSSQSHILSPCTTLGNHSGFGQQLCQAISHGKKTPFKRNWCTGMLLHSTSCQQPWRTPTVFCCQCYRQGLEVPESQTSPQAYSSSSTVASCYQLDTRSTQTSHFPRPFDQAVQYHTSNPVYRNRLYQISFRHGQPTKRQQHAGLMMNYLFVPALHYDNIHPNFTRQINTSSSMEMRFISPTHPSHQSLQVLYRTRSFRPPRKSTSPCARL